MSSGIDLTSFADLVDTALDGPSPGIVASSNDGQPDLALKGSLMVWDEDHLAWWERGLGETLEGIKNDPRVAILVRNPDKFRGVVRFFGKVEIVSDPGVREAVWRRVPEREKGPNEDVQRQRHESGLAVLVRVDRVRQGPNEIQRRA